MIISFKTLQRLAFTLEAQPEMTVLELKAKIEEAHGKDFPVGSQKLIYLGKILADEDKLSTYNIDEKKFVVVMITRQPPPPPPATEVPPPRLKTDKIQPAKQEPKQESKQNADQSTSSSTPKAASAPSQPERQDNSQLPVAERLDILSHQPQFRQLQHLVQQNPHLLGSTIETLSETNPDLYNFIASHPDAFVSALNQSVLERNGAEYTDLPSPPQTVLSQLDNITDRDIEAIDRLKELGFSEDMATQAYMACNKDEELAANLLFQMDQ